MKINSLRYILIIAMLFPISSKANGIYSEIINDSTTKIYFNKTSILLNHHLYAISNDSSKCAILDVDSSKVFVFNNKYEKINWITVDLGRKAPFLENILVSNLGKLVLLYSKIMENGFEYGLIYVYDNVGKLKINRTTYGGLEAVFSDDQYLFVVHCLDQRGIRFFDNNPKYNLQLLVFNNSYKLIYSKSVLYYSSKLYKPKLIDKNVYIIHGDLDQNHKKFEHDIKLKIK
jgi:hypothetical protein